MPSSALHASTNSRRPTVQLNCWTLQELPGAKLTAACPVRTGVPGCLASSALSTRFSEGRPVSLCPPGWWPLGSWPVDRIAIIGCGGSGKSRLARALGDMLGITPVHLDGLYYDRDWKPLDKEQFAVDNRRQQCLQPADPPRSRGHCRLPGSPRLGMPVGHHPAAAAARRRAARRDWGLRQDHVELRPLHRRIPQADGPARPSAHRRPRWGRPGSRASQPSRRKAVPRDRRRAVGRRPCGGCR